MKNGVLKCCKCNQEKKATGNRVEKYKDKDYVCRECRKKEVGKEDK